MPFDERSAHGRRDRDRDAGFWRENAPTARGSGSGTYHHFAHLGIGRQPGSASHVPAAPGSPVAKISQTKAQGSDTHHDGNERFVGRKKSRHRHKTIGSQ